MSLRQKITIFISCIIVFILSIGLLLSYLFSPIYQGIKTNFYMTKYVEFQLILECKINPYKISNVTFDDYTGLDKLNSRYKFDYNNKYYYLILSKENDRFTAIMDQDGELIFGIIDNYMSIE